MLMESLPHQSWKTFPKLPALVLFGLEALGLGTVVGSGKEAIGTVHPIRVLFGFHIGMLIKMEGMYSSGVVGDDNTASNTAGLFTNDKKIVPCKLSDRKMRNQRHQFLRI